MPLLNQPFDSVNTVLNAARVRLNDALKSLYPTGGAVLGNTQPFSQQAVNSAWRTMQEQLANYGYSDLIEECDLTGCPTVANNDPALQTWVDWFNFSDGVNLFDQPVLPENFAFPLKVWERFTGQNSQFIPMALWIDGIPSCTKQSYNSAWEWRNRRLYMPGSLTSCDLRIRHGKYLPDFLDQGTSRWFEQPVPIMRCLDPLSWYIVAEFASAREGMDAESFRQKGADTCRLVMNRDVRRTQRTNFRRQPRSGRAGNGYTGSDFC